MKKVIVIGSGGSGKSTLARQLGDILKIEVIHLDKLFWKPNWTRTPEDEWAAVVEDLLKGDSWIIDGNFGGTREMRMKACDTVIFLDFPRRVCLYRVLRRAVIYRNRSRPDMAEGCHERFDLEFISWVWNYPAGTRPRVLTQIEQFPDKNIVVLRSRGEIAGFLSRLALDKSK